MCVAIAVDTKMPTESTLKLCEEANRDGGGIAWIHQGRVRWRKGITATEILKLIDANKISPPCLIHFRIATSGGDRKDLCHPFPVSRNVSPAMAGNADRVLAHNGHWGGWSPLLHDTLASKGMTAKGPWSDTRAMAYLAKELGDDVLEKLGQKIVLLDKTGHLKTIGYFYDHDGAKYSNMSWQPSRWENTRRSRVLPFPSRVSETRIIYQPAFSFWDELQKARKDCETLTPREVELKEKVNAIMAASEAKVNVFEKQISRDFGGNSRITYK